MAVIGSYMAWRVRSTAIPYVEAYGEFVLRDVLSVFGNPEKRADELANAEYARLGSQPAGDDCDGDMSTFAEQANNRGLAFYGTMSSFHQTTLNLFTAGLFHLVEQQLANLCHDATIDEHPPKESYLDKVYDWYKTNFQLDLHLSEQWDKIHELRLVANTIKHAEGKSAQDLRQLRPELFRHPALRGDPPDSFSIAFPIHLPLGGDDIYVTEDALTEFWNAATEFLTEIATHFEAHGDEAFG